MLNFFFSSIQQIWPINHYEICFSIYILRSISLIKSSSDAEITTLITTFSSWNFLVTKFKPSFVQYFKNGFQTDMIMSRNLSVIRLLFAVRNLCLQCGSLACGYCDTFNSSILIQRERRHKKSAFKERILRAHTKTA